MRTVVTFPCEGDELVGTLDPAAGTRGILIVSGGNEIRSGAHRGMALLAAELARAGVPVFRFDRRGVGDSMGENRGYASAGSDIVAALAAFRREQPHVTRVVGFGNCDAATALLLHDHDCDTLVLANPWLGDDAAAPPPAAVRARYLRRLADRHAWQRLLRGGVPQLLNTLADMFRRHPEQPLGERVGKALLRHRATIVLASGDRTAQVFAAGIRPARHVPVVRIDTASHSFAGQGAALRRALLDALDGSHDKSVS